MLINALRARIITAIYDNCNLPQNRCQELADAVLSKLGLHMEHQTVEPQRAGGDPLLLTRYVTDWECENNDGVIK